MSDVKKPAKPAKRRPKTGGRKKGTPNKNRVFLSEQLAEAGFDFAKEFAKAYALAPAETRLQSLKELMPYLAPRLTDKDRTVEPTDANEEDQTPTADLLSIVKK